MNVKIRVCLIGCGRAGMIHARDYMGGVPNAVLTALCDPMEQGLKAAAEETGIAKTYADWKDVMKDPEIDAVVVVTPTQFHRDIVIAAANAGKHVFCEKPMASTVKECDEMIEACRKNHVKLQIGFMRRFDKDFRRGKELLDQGAVGKPTLIKSNTYGPSEPKEWMYDVHKNYGPIGEVNSHDFDTVRWYAGSEVKTLKVTGENFRSPEMAEKYPEYYDTCTVMLQFENGVLGMITGAQYVRYGYDARAEILGINGMIKVGGQRANSVEVVKEDMQLQADSVDSWRTLFIDAYREEDNAFIQSIVNDTEPLVTGEDGKKALILVHEGLRSLLEHRTIYLKDGLPVTGEEENK
ncbi:MULTISPECIES: Gfo/Idh/MocA family oxidoreductase [Clostridia]|uniref:Gfo/Idh/MocA family oxidoreductase n=1 Tax=Clostridia TaxID=186801 RepID=UPI00067F3F96|nr:MULTISPECIES: Gfo/Idh/MocA family oxidoreductase [Clostridia]